MTNDQREIHRQKRVIEYAEQFGNVHKTCKNWRPIDHKLSNVLIHKSVKTRWDQDPKYQPKNLKEYIAKNGWPSKLES